MASLKEVKSRIVSVGNTQKITQAMKMVASAKLHRAQGAVERIRKYKDGLESLLIRLNSYGADLEVDFEDEAKSVITSRYMGKGTKEEVKGGEKVAIVVMSSNTGMCGAFNSNVARRLITSLDKYQNGGVMLFPIGKKIRVELLKRGYKIEGDYDTVADRPSHDDAQALSSHLMKLFLSKEVDRVEIIYHRFVSMGAQRLLTETFLPFKMPEEQSNGQTTTVVIGEMDEYIFEPGRDKLIEELIPKVLHVKLYNALLDGYASEHGARMVAMQTASDNANDILEELRMEFNKLRQAGITSELLDIIGGSFA